MKLMSLLWVSSCFLSLFPHMRPWSHTEASGTSLQRVMHACAAHVARLYTRTLYSPSSKSGIPAGGLLPPSARGIPPGKVTQRHVVLHANLSGWLICPPMIRNWIGFSKHKSCCEGGEILTRQAMVFSGTRHDRQR